MSYILWKALLGLSAFVALVYVNYRTKDQATPSVMLLVVIAIFTALLDPMWTGKAVLFAIFWEMLSIIAYQVSKLVR